MPTLAYVIAVPVVLSLLLGLYIYSVNRSPLIATASLMLLVGLGACLAIIDTIDFVTYLRSDSEIPLRDRLWDSHSTVLMVTYAVLALTAIKQRDAAKEMDTKETGDSRSHGSLGTDRA